MMTMRADKQKEMQDRSRLDAESYSTAMLNILADAAEEKENMANTQRAVLNILHDASDEKKLVVNTQRAVLNILDDFAIEQRELDATQKASLNILEDAAEERARLNLMQQAVLNILEDVELEKVKGEEINKSLSSEIEERGRAEAALLRANIEAEAANGELEAFSYSVAHDLRAPLRGIDGFSQALLSECGDQLTEEGKAYLGLMRESAQHMARLIDDLLLLARTSRGEIVRSQFNLAPIAKAIFARQQKLSPDRAVELIMAEEIEVFGDARLLAIALENLVGNAWKFTAKCARARIEIGKKSEEGRSVYFVRDNGAGFDVAYAKKLFLVFQRLHSPQEYEGTGIGLALVQRIIRRHEGRIWGEGEVGKGATFYFTLEANDRPEEAS